MKKELERTTMTTVSTSGDSTVGSGLILSDVADLTATGSTVSTATPITAHLTHFTASSASGFGMYLPLSATTGEFYVLAANTTHGVNLYATGSETINKVAGATAFALTGSAIAVKASSTNWAVIKN